MASDLADSNVVPPYSISLAPDFIIVFSLCTPENFNSTIAGVAAYEEAFGSGFKKSFMMRTGYHLSFAAHWQHMEEHAKFAFDERYSYMNGDWVLLPPPSAKEEEAYRW